ncbi:hypothetical protein CC1G_08044 [Coprinopsis cinerea okayama7|uniref:Uncharacterized protein n=1 Tax=Coprinopsis cinerea (strain Okayama-7 / 130 / ATCC MYA-4618 / FGSC 9003) TaxID=240176 RepID=A8NQE0_COPC7|nr:hypothetical protein CC1G_08044 [Coprinopsis cinerea okayama7\|eukprot:XP_001835535.2 hypothetical protein CC1G_08044 [Coprinopsis cinerea okayama7\
MSPIVVSTAQAVTTDEQPAARTDMSHPPFRSRLTQPKLKDCAEEGLVKTVSWVSSVASYVSSAARDAVTALAILSAVLAKCAARALPRPDKSHTL